MQFFEQTPNFISISSSLIDCFQTWLSSRLIKIDIFFSERPPTKKRRLDITLQNCIMINLKPNLDQPEEVVIPWLQILAALINNLDPEVLEGKDPWLLEIYFEHIAYLPNIESNFWLLSTNKPETSLPTDTIHGLLMFMHNFTS